MNYILWANLYLASFYAFYWFFLRNETFFQLNRWYLLTSGLLSFIIPLLDLSIFSSLAHSVVLAINLPVLEINSTVQLAEQTSSSPSTLLTIYLLGCTVGLLWLLYRYFLVRKKLKSTEHDGAYSFLTSVKVDPSLEYYDRIAEHEHIHTKQLHSLDILFFELIRVFNWFNPIVYLYIRSLKLTHEYIADAACNRSEGQRFEYANILISQAFGTSIHSLENNFFNKPILKNRITMLFRNKSPKSVLMRFSILIPVLLIVLSFQAKKETSVEKLVPEIITSNELPPSISKDLLNSNTDTVNTKVEISPAPVGGIQKFMEYIASSYNYPEAAFEAKVHGKILTSFIVEKDGSLTEIEILRDLGYGTGEEAIRILKESPKWLPGVTNGKPVRVKFTLPIQLNIDLQTNEPSSQEKAE